MHTLEPMQVSKIHKFLRNLAAMGLKGLSEEFDECCSYVPHAVTRLGHDANLKKTRFQGNKIFDF